MKKIIAMLLILCLALSLAACSAKEKSPSYEGEVVGRDLSGYGGARLFSSKTLSLPDPGVTAKSAVKAGEDVFIYAQDDSGDNYFYLMGMNSTLSKADLFLRNEVVAMDGGPDGTVYLLSQAYDGSYGLEQVNGMVEKVITLPFLSELGDAVNGIAVTPQGYLFKTNSKLLCCDTSGNFIREYGDYMGYFELIKNGTEIVLVVRENGGTSFNVLGSDFEIESTYTVPQELSLISAGPGAGHVFTSNGGIIYDVDFTTGERTGYSNEYASGEARNFIYLSDDSYFGLINGECMYYLVDSGEGKNVTSLTLATYSSDYALKDMLEVVRKFNGLSPEYRIDVVNYATYDDGETSDAGLLRLNVDILSGNTPDIYDLSCLDVLSLSNKGLLEDLKPWFEGSEEVRLDQLTESVVRALTYKGALYSLVPAYRVTTMYGSSTLTNPDTWSVETFLDLANSATQSLFGPALTKADYLRLLLTLTGGAYIDLENARCDFVNSSFPAMLALADKVPADRMDADCDDYGWIFTGQQLFFVWTGGTLRELCSARAAYSGNLAVLGFPSQGSGTALRPEQQLGMSSASENKEGVWSFFEYLLSDSVQSGLPSKVLPVKQAVLDAKMDEDFSHVGEIIRTGELKNVMGFADGQIYSIPYLPVTPEDRDAVLELIDRMDCVDICGDTLYELVLREATPFFQGGITAQQAAENIQSKVSLYLSEQYG